MKSVVNSNFVCNTLIFILMIPDVVDLENNFTDFKISHIMNLSQDNSATFQLMGILQNVTMNG